MKSRSLLRDTVTSVICVCLLLLSVRSCLRYFINSLRFYAISSLNFIFDFRLFRHYHFFITSIFIIRASLNSDNYQHRNGSIIS